MCITLLRGPMARLVPRELFKPVSLAIRDLLIDGLLKTEQRYRDQNVKRLCYLSMEFLMGRWLSDNLCNLGLNEPLPRGAGGIWNQSGRCSGS